MIEEAVLYHSVMSKLFLGLLFANLLIPSLFKSNRSREIKMTRISFFFYSAMLSMLAFTGIILYMLMTLPWNLQMTLMSIAFLLLSGVEIARSRKLVRVWMKGESAVSYSWPYVLSEMAITGIVILLMAVEKKDAVPL